MSRMWNELAARRPDWSSAPNDLERAWEWMEEQGFGRTSPNGYLLTPCAPEAEIGVVFSPELTLDGLCEPGSEAETRLLPIAEADGDGSIAALWRDDEGEVRVVTLTSEGEGYVIAPSPRDFCALVAMGYSELTELELAVPPENPSAVSAFRAWVEQELRVPVPEEWPAVGDDAFSAWFDGQLDEEAASTDLPAETGLTTGGDAAAFAQAIGQPDGPDLAELVGEIAGVKLGESLRKSTKALHSVGLEVIADRGGLHTLFITLEDYPHPDNVVPGLKPGDSYADVRERLGPPEAERERWPWLRYIANGRYLHFDFYGGAGLHTISVMRETP